MGNVSWEAWFTLASAVILLIGMARRWAPPDLLSLAILAAIVVVGQISGSPKLPDPATALKGFGSTSLLTVAFLFVVVAGLEATGGTELAFGWLLRRPRNLTDAQARLLIPTAVISGFLNNTPVVAAMMPIAGDLAKRMGVSPSKLFLPISYAAILGGVCTILGTSTNLIVNDMLSKTGSRPIAFFELGYVGIPVAVVGLLYVLVGSRWLLPDRRPAVSVHDDPRRYTVEMVVQSGGPLVGRTIEDAGLRHLPGLFLAELQRGATSHPAVDPQEKLEAGDLLIFVGVVESIVDLTKIRGLTAATDQTQKLNVPAWTRGLVEAVVSTRCPIVGKTIREGRFRTRYRAAVIAVARGGKRIEGKLGDVVLEPGDVLLLEAPPTFATQYRDAPDFFLVSKVENSAPRRHSRAWPALLIMGLMIFAASSNLLELSIASLIAALAMIGVRCCTLNEARESVDWSVLVVIGATLGIGLSIDSSGAAKAVADVLLGLAGDSPLLTLAAIYVATMLVTELITNNAAAALMFPLSYSTAVSAGLNPIPFAIAVMVAASAGFATPFGYQTNLMVYGPGGYRPSDYLKIGAPLDLLAMVVSLIVIPLVWPLKL